MVMVVDEEQIIMILRSNHYRQSTTSAGHEREIDACFTLAYDVSSVTTTPTTEYYVDRTIHDYSC